MVRRFFQYLSRFSKELKSMSTGTRLYYIPMGNLDWAKVIGIIEQNKHRIGIFDYIIETRSLKEIMYKTELPS